MNTSILSPKHQIVIPKEVRKKLDLRPGQRLQIEVKDGHIEIEPILIGESLIGYLKGSEPLSFEREVDRLS